MFSALSDPQQVNESADFQGFVTMTEIMRVTIVCCYRAMVVN